MTQLKSAVISINRLSLAAILVEPEQTYPEPGARVIGEAQRYFPTLPIILVSPRVSGFSRSFAHFDTTDIIKHINTDQIEWSIAQLPTEPTELPF